MTSFEHAMLGMNAVLATGLHRRWGYQLVALAGVAATLPDWDGATILVSRSAFATGHRVWGHNLLACTVLGMIFGWLDYRYDLVTRASRRLAAWTNSSFPAGSLTLRYNFTLAGLMMWTLVASLAVMSHLVADLVVSGTTSLPDWKLKLLWPFSQQGWVFPMVPWGDASITLIFVGGMFAMLRWRSRTQTIAQLTLFAVAGYVFARNFV